MFCKIKRAEQSLTGALCSYDEKRIEDCLLPPAAQIARHAADVIRNLSHPRMIFITIQCKERINIDQCGIESIETGAFFILHGYIVGEKSTGNLTFHVDHGGIEYVQFDVDIESFKEQNNDAIRGVYGNQEEQQGAYTLKYDESIDEVHLIEAPKRPVTGREAAQHYVGQFIKTNLPATASFIRLTCASENSCKEFCSLSTLVPIETSRPGRNEMFYVWFPAPRPPNLLTFLSTLDSEESVDSISFITNVSPTLSGFYPCAIAPYHAGECVLLHILSEKGVQNEQIFPVARSDISNAYSSISPSFKSRKFEMSHRILLDGRSNIPFYGDWGLSEYSLIQPFILPSCQKNLTFRKTDNNNPMATLSSTFAAKNQVLTDEFLDMLSSLKLDALENQAGLWEMRSLLDTSTILHHKFDLGGNKSD